MLFADADGVVAATFFPADRRPQQIQNVETALLVMEEVGCTVSTRADDVVNGVRDKTLELLWTIIHSLQASRLAAKAIPSGMECARQKSRWPIFLGGHPSHAAPPEGGTSRRSTDSPSFPLVPSQAL